MIQHTLQGAVDIVAVLDALTHANADAAAASIEKALRPGQPRVVLDLKQVALCDSRGLELILDLRDRCLRRGGALKLAGATHLCHDILRVTGLLDQIEYYPGVVEAAGSFAA